MSENKKTFWKPSKKFVLIFFVVCILFSIATTALIYKEGASRYLMLPLIVLFGPTFSLMAYVDLAFPKGDFTTKDVLKIWGKNVLRFLEETVDFLKEVVSDMLLRAIYGATITVFMGMFALYILTLPGGLVGLIAQYLVGYSRLTNQPDFTTVYAVFSSAVVMLFVISLSLTMNFMKVYRVLEDHEERGSFQTLTPTVTYTPTPTFTPTETETPTP